MLATSFRTQATSYYIAAILGFVVVHSRRSRSYKD